MSFLKLKSSLCVLCILLPLSVWADAVIPYSGSLYSQGKPVSRSTPIKMGFALYQGAPTFDEGPTESARRSSVSTAGTRVWMSWVGDENVVQTTSDVYVRQGRFLAHVGEVLDQGLHRPMADLVLDAQPLYLVVWILPDESDSASIRRLPPQRLQSVPHAVTARRATDFEIKGDLQVDGSLHMGNGTTRPSISMDTPGSSNIPHGWSSRGTYIEMGEGVHNGERVGGDGTAKINMSYTGDGFGYTGTGRLEDGIPSGGFWRYQHDSRDVYTSSSVSIDGALNLQSNLHFQGQGPNLSSKGHVWVGGLLIQWGQKRFSGIETTDTFSRSFPNEVFVVVGNSADASTGTNATVSKNSLHRLNLHKSLTNARTISWIAIGR